MRWEDGEKHGKRQKGEKNERRRERLWMKRKRRVGEEGVWGDGMNKKGLGGDEMKKKRWGGDGRTEENGKIERRGFE